MVLRLKQFDITLNQMFNPLNNIDNTDKLVYYNDLKRRIDRRVNQINNLIILLNNDLDDKNYYETVLQTYDICFDHNAKFNVNFVSDYKLSLIVGYKSDKKFKDKIYTMKEIMSFFRYDKIMLNRINVIEYDDEYMNEHYNTSHIVRVSDKELMATRKYLYRELNKMNKNILNDIKSILSKEKLLNDLNNLLEFTLEELKAINNNQKLKLTYNDYYDKI